MEGVDAVQKAAMPMEHDRLQRIEDLTTQLETAIDYTQNKIGPIVLPTEQPELTDLKQISETTFDGIIDRLEYQIHRLKSLNTRIRL